MPDREWWTALFSDPAAILRSLGVRSDMTVLDLCCGDGYFTAPLAHLVNGNVFALDLDGALLESARAEVERQGGSVLEWIVADAQEADRRLPRLVDYVLVANTFHGVPDRAGFVSVLARCLKPGGRVGLLNWRPLPRDATTVLGEARGPATELRLGPEETMAALSSGGFCIEHVVDVPPYHYGVIASLPENVAPGGSPS